jgi:CheY-like chemotaxis protein
MLQRQHLEGPLDGPRRVLLVSADLPVRGLVSTFLGSMGCSCVIAAGAVEFANLELANFDAVVIDGADSGMDTEQAIARIIELHPSLAERILVLSNAGTDPQLLESVERQGLRQMSREILLQQLWAMLQEILAGPQMARLRPRNNQITQLIFDRLRAPLPDGVHALPATGRQLVYKHTDTLIDIVMEPTKESGRVSLAGRVETAGIPKSENNGHSVLLTDGIKTLARTRINKLGEFNLEFDVAEDAGLQIRLDEGSWAFIPLGKMDWVRKQVSACEKQHGNRRAAARPRQNGGNPS